MTQLPVAPVAGEEDEQIKSGQVGNGRITEPADAGMLSRKKSGPCKEWMWLLY